jgi:hypothetical protein
MHEFYQYPQRFILSIEQINKELINKTSITLDTQQHHEIIRQCFDNIDFGFLQYSELLKNIPVFNNLIDGDKYTDVNGNINYEGISLRNNVYNFGIALYMSCTEAGVIMADRTPYILETVNNNLCLLFNSVNPPQ